MRVNGEVMVARTCSVGVDASGAAVDPRHNGAEGVVVIGVHRGVSCVAIPAFPPGGSSLLHHIAPRGIRVLQEKFEGEIGAVILVEYKHEKRSAKEARGEMVAM